MRPRLASRCQVDYQGERTDSTVSPLENVFITNTALILYKRSILFFFFFSVLGLLMWHMEAPRLGVEQELQLPA